MVLFFCKEKKGFPLAITLYAILAFTLLRTFEYLPLNLQYVYLVLYTIFEYLFFTHLIFVSIKNKKIKHLILVLSVCFILFQAFFGSKIHRLDSISVGIETILLFIYIFLFFYDHSKSNKTSYIYNHPTFWVSVGILLYLGGSFFFNILVNYMTSAEYDSYWHYTYFAEILKNILFAVAVLITSKQHKLNSLKQSQVPYLDIDMN